MVSALQPEVVGREGILVRVGASALRLLDDGGRQWLVRRGGAVVEVDVAAPRGEGEGEGEGGGEGEGEGKERALTVQFVAL